MPFNLQYGKLDRRLQICTLHASMMANRKDIVNNVVYTELARKCGIRVVSRFGGVRGFSTFVRVEPSQERDTDIVKEVLNNDEFQKTLT